MKIKKHISKWTAFSLCYLMAVLCCASVPANDRTNATPTPAFNEIWGYLMKGEEKELTGIEPFTHICYFSASPNTRGRITGTIPRPAVVLANGMKPSVHLVIAELSNHSLMHFSLSPDYGIRDLLIADIVRVSALFDGVQIDFEAVAPDDSDSFMAFLAALREKLPQDKMLSIAVPARTRHTGGAYDYRNISRSVDRVFIMAYDQHWGTSKPGPVASLPWCRDVVVYASSVIPKEKIVMGLPLYGRAWQDKKLHRAVRYRQVEELISATKTKALSPEDIGPNFNYTEQVIVTVYYDDESSILKKLKMYEMTGISSVSFWRIGQGPAGLWGAVKPSN